jgi:hypothetical protein
LNSRKIELAVSFFFALMLAVTQAAAQTAAPPAAPATTATQTADPEPVGNVATLQGNATVTRDKTTTALKLQDDVFKNDVLQTGANSTLGVTFNDDTTFNLTANSRIAVDDFVYEEGAKTNAAIFNVARGTVAFVASAVAKTGDMKISTPTATLGIRGTTGLVEVPEGASATSANNVGIKLYPDADGRVGRIDIRGRDGAQLGLLTQASTGFAIRGGAGGRFAAVPLQISPQQAARDQGIVRQVRAAQVSGRRIVTQQRALRQQRNPQLRQPGQQRQPGLQRQQPGLQKQPPGLPRQPGLQKQTGPQTQPSSRPLQPPGLQRPLQRAPLASPPKRKPAPPDNPRGRRF